MSLTFALQALLVRHEAYVVQAEDERRQMTASIEQLEREKKRCALANARTIEENRDLLDQLEDLNSTVTSSDAYIYSLTTTLKSTRHEFNRLTMLAARSTELESQLLAMEMEQQSLQDQLLSTEGEKRSAVHRWKNAERTISSLQDQVDRIEKEANDERARHEEVVSWFERRKAVECELESAARGLTDAGTAATVGKDKGSSSVVSHFVKDILQDNANLQLGIVELREMLIGSNEEIEKLREQMILHQPTLSLGDDGVSKTLLRSELARSTAAEAVPELHVHHHYHPAEKANSTRKEKSSVARRPRNRRNATTAGLLASSSGFRTSRTPSIKMTPPSSTAAILSQTSVTIPPALRLRAPRWPMHYSQHSSSVAMSSVPSSPKSAFRNSSFSSIFDNIDTTLDTSQPTSPASTNMESPYFPSHKRTSSDLSLASLSAHMAARTQPTASWSLNGAFDAKTGDKSRASIKQSMDIDAPPSHPITVTEEREEDLLPDRILLPPLPDLSLSKTFFPTPNPRRSASHESLLSTIPPNSLRHKPSQLLTNRLLPSRTPLSISRPTINPASAVAQPASSANHSLRLTSHTYNRSLLSARTPSAASSRSSRLNNHHFTPSPSNRNLRNATSDPVAPQGNHPTFSKRVGGWVWGKWGVVPMASMGDLRAQAALGRERATGVNQKGSVTRLGGSLGGSGIERESRGRSRGGPRPSRVEAVNVDESALRESLGEG